MLYVRNLLASCNYYRTLSENLMLLVEVISQSGLVPEAKNHQYLVNRATQSHGYY